MINRNDWHLFIDTHFDVFVYQIDYSTILKSSIDFQIHLNWIPNLYYSIDFQVDTPASYLKFIFLIDSQIDIPYRFLNRFPNRYSSIDSQIDIPLLNLSSIIHSWSILKSIFLPSSILKSIFLIDRQIDIPHRFSNRYILIYSEIHSSHFLCLPRWMHSTKMSSRLVSIYLIRLSIFRHQSTRP